MALRVRVQAVEAAVLAAHMQYGLDYVIFRTVRPAPPPPPPRALT
jgi:hypothetical protein